MGKFLFMSRVNPLPHDQKLSLYWPRLLEGDESGGVGGTDPGLAVLHGFVGDGENSPR